MHAKLKNIGINLNTVLKYLDNATVMIYVLSDIHGNHRGIKSTDVDKL